MKMFWIWLWLFGNCICGSSYVMVIKLGYIHCLCNMNENILKFFFCPLSIVLINILMGSLIKLVCLPHFCNMNESLLTFVLSPLIVVSLRVPAASVIKIGRMCWLGKINKSFFNFLCVSCCDRDHKIRLYVLFLAVWIRILLILCCVQSA